jgi:AraC-like DNA-binding protein
VQYFERPPAPLLAPYVRKLWFLHGPRPARYEKILPLPFVHFIVNLSDPYWIVGPDGDRHTELAAGFVSGIQPRYVVIEDPDELHHVGIELEPYGIRAFSAVPVAELTTTVRASGDVLPGSDELREHLAGCTAEDACDRLEQFVLELPRSKPDPRVVAACRRIDTDSDLDIASLATDFGIAHRTLIELFRRYCGIAPKAYADVVRLHQFLNALPLDGRTPTWTELVASSSYYDQSHFIATFKRFTGFTPARYLDIVGRLGRDYASFVPIGDLG